MTTEDRLSDLEEWAKDTELTVEAITILTYKVVDFTLAIREEAKEISVRTVRPGVSG